MTVDILSHHWRRKLHTAYIQPCLLKRIKSVLLQRQTTRLVTGFHILRTVPTLVTPKLEAEKIQKLKVEIVGEAGEAEETEIIEGVEGNGEVEQVGRGPTRRKNSGVRNGRMSTRLPPQLHSR